MTISASDVSDEFLCSLLELTDSDSIKEAQAKLVAMESNPSPLTDTQSSVLLEIVLRTVAVEMLREDEEEDA
jgi:hypothetical protein